MERLGTRKNELVLDLIRREGVEAYEGSIRYVEAARDAGLRRAVVSSSANTREVLESTGMLDLFEAIVDGLVAARDGLSGKPAPDTFVAGARELGVEPAEAAVFEDALAGVEAGRAGDFGYVVGVDRTGTATRRVLRERGRRRRRRGPRGAAGVSQDVFASAVGGSASASCTSTSRRDG